MLETIKKFFSSDMFMPHGHCYLWRPDILWLNVGSDALIAFSYYAIPILLIYFVRNRKDLAYHWIFIMFAAFIIACGTTHLMDIFTVWNPLYGWQGLVKFATALISIATAIALVPIMPKILALPSPKELERVNAELKNEIETKRRAEVSLMHLNQDLEMRVKVRSESSQKQAERLKSVVDHIVDGIITINEKFEIESWNTAAKNIFEYEESEVIGKNVKILMPDTYANHHDQYVSNYLVTGKAKVIGIGREVVGRKKDGSTFPMDLAISEFRLGEKRFFTGIVRDITDRKKIDEELRAAKEAAEAANLAKSAFLANMSHEIRTPLGAVMGFSQLLAETGLPESVRENYIDTINRNGELLSAIINDVLDLSKVEAGKIELDINEVSIDEILSDVTSVVNFQATDKGIKLAIYSDGPIPIKVSTDPLRLRQILINIIGNAIKFTDKGTVDVTIKQEVAPDGAVMLAFVIEDSGVGISDKQKSNLFKLFSQADASITNKHGGTGLGLVLSKKLAQLLGGDVELTKSKEGVGSTFTVTIAPGATQSVIFENYNHSRETQFPRSSETNKVRLDGLRILLVDDMRDNQVLVSRVLKGAGAHVEVAENGKVALQMAGESNFDIILMDLRMPVMDGFEATSELRKSGFKSPIIALTAHALKEERQYCLSHGFDDHLCKPIDRRILIERIASLHDLQSK